MAVLVLTPNPMDFLWVSSMLKLAEELVEEIHWCEHPSELEACLAAVPCQLVIWDSSFSEQNSLTYLSYLSVQTGHAPIIALGADEEKACVQAIFSAGGADYLCKRFLSPWGLEKSIRFALYRAQSEEQVNRRSQVDSLTGVVNRNLFFDRLNHSLQRARRNRDLVGMMILNIDNFQAINDTFGYKSGDGLIRSVALRLNKTLRESDSIARIAGDEFAIVLEKLDSFYACINVAEKLVDLFQSPFLVNDEPTKITMSLGIACFPETGQTAEDLVRFANRGMLNAKKEHGNSYQYYNQAMNRELSKTLKLESDFRKAIRHGELRLFYQPRIDIANNTLIGMESLVRWQHPELGLLTPDQFIPMAERTGMIVPMGYWVIDQACRDVGRFQELGYQNLTCGVNLSFRQFQDKKLAETIFRIILNAGVDPSCIELELTESTMMQNWEVTLHCLEEIANFGIAFALDDFGTGFSSFSHLHKLPISTLKIDKSFIDDLESSRDSQNIVNAVVGLAHNLQMSVVAEGVESEAQLHFLQYHHCDQVQGYYFGKPVPFDAFLSVLHRFYPASELQLN